MEERERDRERNTERTDCATDPLRRMSVLFYTYRDGEKSHSYRYEVVDEVSYGKDKGGKPQIGVVRGKITTYSWGLGPDDIRLTQESHEKAAVFYNERLIKVGEKRKRTGGGSDSDSKPPKKN